MRDLTVFRYVHFILWDAQNDKVQRERKAAAMWEGIQQVWT